MIAFSLQEEKPCPHYMRTYACKFGPACKFDHPQPASLESDLPIPGAAAIGTMGSTLPSTGIPYVGPLPPWHLSRSSYVASSCVPGPQTYMPFVFPPLQSSLTAQNWNSYTVCKFFFFLISRIASSRSLNDLFLLIRTCSILSVSAQYATPCS